MTTQSDNDRWTLVDNRCHHVPEDETKGGNICLNCGGAIEPEAPASVGSDVLEALSDPQRYVLETLVNGNGHFVYADPADYSCEDGSHDTGQARTCNCRAGWHAERVTWDRYRVEGVLWFMNRTASKSLIEKKLLRWDEIMKRGWITASGRAALAQQPTGSGALEALLAVQSDRSVGHLDAKVQNQLAAATTALQKAALTAPPATLTANLFSGCGEHETDWQRDCDECDNTLKENSDNLLDLVAAPPAATEPCHSKPCSLAEGHEGMHARELPATTKHEHTYSGKPVCTGCGEPWKPAESGGA